MSSENSNAGLLFYVIQRVKESFIFNRSVSVNRHFFFFLHPPYLLFRSLRNNSVTWRYLLWFGFIYSRNSLNHPLFIKYCHESGENNTRIKTWKVGKKEIYLNVCTVLTVSDITGSIFFFFLMYNFYVINEMHRWKIYFPLSCKKCMSAASNKYSGSCLPIVRCRLDLHLYFLSVCSTQMNEISLQNLISKIEVAREWCI